MTPYTEGAKAYWDYKSLADNPYDKTVMAYDRWESGFIDSRALDNGDIYDEAGDHPANEKFCK